MARRFPSVLFFLLFAIFLFIYSGVLSHIIFYQEQHHLFLFTSRYFYQTLYTEGFLEYLTRFLIQFFYYPVLGAIFLSLLLASIYKLLYYNIQVITGKRDILLLSLFPSLYFFIQTMKPDYSLRTIVGCFLLLLLFSCINCLLEPYWRKYHILIPRQILNKRLHYAITLSCLLLYIGGTFYVFVRSYNMGEYRMLQAEKAMKERNWQEVLMQTDLYLKKRQNNQLIYYFRNIALFHTDRLLTHLLDYPLHLGVKALYFPWESDSRKSEYGHFIYEELGHINEAQRWESEAMVVWGETAPHLINLARYNIVNHRPKVAQRFINLLKQSLFYRKEAVYLETCLHSGTVQGLRVALPYNLHSSPAHFSNVMNLGPELQYICQNDPSNRMAFEYLMCNLLLSNQVVRFVENLPFIHNFDYLQMPVLFEEALLIYKMGVSEDTFVRAGFSIDKRTEQRFQRYCELYQQKNMEQLKQEFGKSYWYYLNFISPYGNKIIAQK